MSEFLNAAWPHLLTGAGTLIIAYLSLPTKFVESKLAKQLEEFKAKHSKELEELKFNLSQRAVRLAKVHEKDLEMLEVILEKLVALDSVFKDLMNPFGVQYNLSRMSDGEAEQVLKKLELSNDEVTEILKLPGQDRDRGLYAIEQRRKFNRCATAGNDFQKAHAACSPFLAEDVDNLIEELSKLFVQTFHAKSMEKMFEGDLALKANQEAGESFSQITGKINSLKQLIRRSLREESC